MHILRLWGVLLLQIGTGLQTIYDGHVGRIDISTNIAIQILLGLIQVGDDEVKHLVERNAGVVGSLLK